MLPGAVLTRVAASHIRVGTFQYFAARGDVERVRQLAEYSIARHDPDLVGTPGRFLALLERVAARQAALIAQWMNVGFIHGVMNTDNMTISGETIDYGPCAFVEAYDPAAVFSSIDSRGRYAFGNQPGIAPLEPDAPGRDAAAAHRRGARRRREAGHRGDRGVSGALSRATCSAASAPSSAFARRKAPTTLPTRRWRTTGSSCCTPAGPTSRSPGGAWPTPPPATRRRCGRSSSIPRRPMHGCARWRERCAREDEGARGRRSTAGEARAARMRSVNPWVIPRNHRVEEALAAASDDDDLGPFERLLDALRRPYDEIADHAAYAEPAPVEVTACYRTFCGT